MKHSLPAILFFLWFSNLNAQTYNMSNTPITDCTGSFFDSGGATGNYGNNQNLTTTICSDGTGGTHIRLSFSGVDLQAGDELCFYDGPNTSAPLLACASDFNPGDPFVIQATAVNPTGCLTVTFNSDATGNAGGWSSVISCVASCQQVLSELVSTNPAAVPADTGWIDICPGERVFFTGQGVYPQNGFAYNQSDFTTTFEWSFGDGDIAYGPTVSHRYDQPGGYFVQLFLTDVQGCKSTNLINQRIRVAPRPTFNLASIIDDAICAGDTIFLSAAVDSLNGENLLVTPGSSAFEVEGSRSDSLALPDGTGVGYETSIYFTEFSPGQVLTNINDLESICVNMEHSWMRDIEISITCPNGQSIVLHNFGGQTGSQVFLGIPNDADGFNPIPGSGFDYCWTPNATNATWLVYANTVLGGFGTLPAGDYSSFDPMSDLLGCPLNGEWTITVTDLWPIDNGFIFSWGLQFNSALYPDVEVFSPAFVDWTWSNHPSIFAFSPDSIAAAPQNAGTAAYTFTVSDAFGCNWDTLVNVSVLPFTHPDCYSCNDQYATLSDTSVCDGESVALDASFQGITPQPVRFEAFPDYRIGNGNHPHTNPYSSPIAVNSLGFNLLTNPTTQIESICIDLETDFDADMNIYLRSPDGKQLELSTGNGGGGDNYKITCFTPTAVTPIVGSTAPFNGSYIPEGAWSSLNNAVVDGNWQLLVSDGFGVNQLGKLKWWSITFNVPTNVNYTWSNAGSLSCTNCPTPIASPSVPTTYTVLAIDNFNCIHRDTVTVDIQSFFPAPTGLTASIVGGGGMEWTWVAVGGATGYEVSINGGAWIPANGSLSHTLSGLTDGDVVSLEVRALGGSPNCPPETVTGQLTYNECLLEVTVDSTLPAICPGTATGSAILSTTNGATPIQFTLVGSGATFPNGNLIEIFTAGTQSVVVRDASGCRDTATFNITEPSAIVLTAAGTDVLCSGGLTGTLDAVAVGGNGSFTFVWQGCNGGALLSGAAQSGLSTGCYAVTATDANGCTRSDSVTVNEPLPFNVTGSTNPVTCYGGSNGSAGVSVGGAQPPYNYIWGTGNTTPSVGNLPAGIVPVTIVDFVGCQTVFQLEVLQPPALQVVNFQSIPVGCFGDSTSSATITTNGGILPYQYLWSDGQTNATATDLPAGLYTVTVTDFNGCTTTGSGQVTTPTPLSTQISSQSNETCFNACNGSISITTNGGAGGYQFVWSNPSVPPGTTSSNNLCADNYSITVSDMNGCSEVLQTNIQAALQINIALTPTQPTCAGISNGSLQSGVTGGAPPYQYVWSDGTTLPNANNLDCGITYSLTVTDNNICTVTVSSVLDCPAVLQVDDITATNALCFGQSSGTASVEVSGGTPPYSYLWSDANAQTGSTANALPAGIYTVTITDQNGCANTAQTTVGQPTALAVALTDVDVTCFGGTDGAVSTFASGGTPPYTYNWNTAQSGGDIVNLAAGTYNLTLTDANQCILTGLTATVGQPATNLVVVATQTKMACAGEPDGIAEAQAVGGNGAPFGFVWSNGAQGQETNNLAPGSYSVTASDSKGCTATTSLEITALDSILLLVANTLPTCFGASDGQAALNYISGGAGNGDTTLYDYTWSVPGSANAYFITGLIGGQNYTLTATDDQGCTGSYSFYLDQPDPILLQMQNDSVSCSGLSDGSATVVVLQSDNPVVSYTWNNGFQGPQNANLSAGNYAVTVEDTNGCKSTANTVVEAPAPLQILLSTVELLCFGTSDASISAVVSGGNQQYSYQWSNGGNSNNINQLGAGTYTLTVTDQKGCTLEETVTLQQPLPITITSEKTDPGCFGAADGRITLKVEGGQQPYLYSRDQGPFGGSPTFIGLKSGVYQFVVRDANGCTGSLTDSLEQPLPVGVSLGPDTTIFLGDSLLLGADVSNAFGDLTYAWRSYLIDTWMCIGVPECAEIWVTPPFTNTYVLEITDENGCTAEAKIKIDVEKPRGAYVPTGFTPNGDFTNDLLVVYGKSRMIKQVNNFKVFDRWGELVYEDSNFAVNDETRGWDGRWRGKECDPGVFVWTLEVEYIDGVVDQLHGNTTLIR
ncbi:MAG: proprotein convertase P-domain-containing protein [Saprospiraceae bacterium]|nr:proprotein convertase P-domain-containing protein [Saprospiraceae bacterium]